MRAPGQPSQTLSSGARAPELDLSELARASPQAAAECETSFRLGAFEVPERPHGSAQFGSGPPFAGAPELGCSELCLRNASDRFRAFEGT
eukprot:6283406-Alexandrium_andersonii.AAC.1